MPILIFRNGHLRLSLSEWVLRKVQSCTKLLWSHSACEEISFFAHLMKQSTMITAFDTYGHIISHQTGSPETSTNWVTFSAVRWGDNKHWVSTATVRPLRSLPIIIITIIQHDLVDTVIVAHRRKLSLLHDRRLLCISHISVIIRSIFNNPSIYNSDQYNVK